MMTGVRTVVLDLGGVLLSSTAVLDALAARLGVGAAELERAYLPPREGYDLGDPDEAYWAAVGTALGIVVTSDDARELTAIDVAKWAELPAESLAFLDALADRRCTVLSNAPAGLAATVRAAPWSRRFAAMVFSAEVGLVKPGAAIFAEADRVFGTHHCVFFDDKPANVEAARAHGWEAHVWAGPEAALGVLGEGRGSTVGT